jgi:hypothetical protein
VVIAAGPPLTRTHPATRAQLRGECAGRCDPRDYLEAAPPERGGEDNADFSDRLDAGRGANTNGFIRGPVHGAQGALHVNDRVLALGEAELGQRVMRRVALEVRQCLAFYASRPENAGRYPLATPACGGAPAPAWGRVPDTPFIATRVASGGRMLERWWRSEPRVPERTAELPTALHACRLAAPPADEGEQRTLPAGTPRAEGESAAAPAWWNAWKPHVFYAPAAAFAAGGPADCGAPGACIELVTASGEPLAPHRQAIVVVTRAPGECATPALECNAARCVRARAGIAGHEVAALP